MSWQDDLREKQHELELIATWASLTQLGRVRDFCRNAIYELQQEIDRHDKMAIRPIRTENYEAIPTGDKGFNSGRPRYKVTCNKCGKIVHENTTGPQSMYEMHQEQCEANNVR